MKVMLLYGHINCVPKHITPNGCPVTDQNIIHKADMATDNAFVQPKIVCVHTGTELQLLEINGKVVF